MNIDEMPAGPELDRLVAERVMGWQMGLGPATVVRWWFSHGADKQFHHSVEGWSPSTHIDHAWEVVEKAIASNGCASVQSTGFEWDRRFIARIQFGTCFTTDRSAIADTAPLAICIAALKAVDHP